MRLLKLLFLYILSLLLMICDGNALSYNTPFMQTDVSTPKELNKYTNSLITEINKLHPHSKQHYILYTANFFDGHSVPTVQDHQKDSKHILWLGSVNNFQMADFSQYDIILAASPIMQKFLRDQGINAFYFPLFGLDNKPIKEEYKYVAVIGNPPLIEDELIRRRIFYRKYKPYDWDKIYHDMSHFKAIFVKNSQFSPSSLDVSPVLLEAALMKIPMAIHYSYDFLELLESITLLNDALGFYDSSADLNLLIDEFLSPSPTHKLSQQLDYAQQLVRNYFSLTSNVKKLDYIIQHMEQPDEILLPNTLNIDIPVSVGHIAAGDYWMAYDLNGSFQKYHLNTSMSFFNSYFIRPSAVNIIVAGFLPKTYEIYRPFVSKINIVYVAYGQFPQHGDDLFEQVEDIVDQDTYLMQLEKLYQDSEVQALVLASQSLVDALNQRGISAFYIPQFTNPDRFYPKYDDSVKSEVFFVGKNSFYRKAVPALLKAGLPVTIYGPYWNGLAKGDYLDNRELYRYYSSAKIVLNDTRDGMKKYGFISNRIFDASACGSLVISDYMPEIEKIYGDSVPMWKTEEELVELVKYYLDPEHEAERKEKAERARQITLHNFTVDMAVKKFMHVIDTIR